jgi:hypothetical protein
LSRSPSRASRSRPAALIFGTTSVRLSFIISHETKYFSEIYRTWSCDTCYMIEADLVPPSSFDSSDFFELGLSVPIEEASQWSFPVKSVNQTVVNKENIVKIDFTKGDLASIERTGFWKVKFQVEIKKEFSIVFRVIFSISVADFLKTLKRRRRNRSLSMQKDVFAPRQLESSTFTVFIIFYIKINNNKYSNFYISQILLLKNLYT